MRVLGGGDGIHERGEWLEMGGRDAGAWSPGFHVLKLKARFRFG